MLQAESFEEFNLEDAIALVVEIFFEECLNDVLGGEGFEVALDEDIELLRLEIGKGGTASFLRQRSMFIWIGVRLVKNLIHFGCSALVVNLKRR